MGITRKQTIINLHSTTAVNIEGILDGLTVGEIAVLAKEEVRKLAIKTSAGNAAYFIDSVGIENMIDAAVSGMPEDIEELQKEVEKLRQEVGEQGEQTGTLWAAVAALAGRLDNHDTDIARLQAISADTRLEALEKSAHTHENKDLLDTYTQTEANLADAVAKKHEHGNKAVLDGITSEKVAGWETASAQTHIHDNKVVLDGITSAKVTTWDAAEENVLEGVQVNGTDLTIDSNKKVNVTIATGTGNGTIAVNGTDVSVKGLGSAAFTETTAYDEAGAANTAEANAKAYTNDVHTAITTEIATAKQEAIDTASTYTDNQIDEAMDAATKAIADAKQEAIDTASAYTDTQISSLNVEAISGDYITSVSENAGKVSATTATKVTGTIQTGTGTDDTANIYLLNGSSDAVIASKAYVDAKTAGSYKEGNGISLDVTGNVTTISAKGNEAKAIKVDVDGIELVVNSNDKVLSIDSTNGLQSTINLVYDTTAATDGKKYIRLQGVDGTDIATIDASEFIKDGMLKSATYDSTAHTITLKWNTDAGISDTVIDVSDLVDTYTAGDGLQVSNNKFSIKLDSTTNTALTVGTNGLKLDLSNYATTAITDGLDTRLTTAEGEIDALQADSHTHENKTVLDGITSAKVSAWDSAEANAIASAKTYTDNAIATETARTESTYSKTGHTHVIADVTGLQDALNAKVDDTELVNYYTSAETNTQIANAIAAETARTESVYAKITVLNTLSGQVETNTNNISTNTANIATNTANIATNTDDIAALQTTVEGKAEQTDLTALSGQVGTNKTNIEANASAIETIVDGEEINTFSAVEEALADKVDVVAGKQLSTEDYTTEEKTKLSGIEEGAQVNVIETVKVNGTALTVTNKAVDIEIPSAFIKEVDNTESVKLTVSGGMLTADVLVVDGGTF